MIDAEGLLQYVTRATVETTYLPTIAIDKPFQPGEPNPLLELLRPRITLELQGGLLKPLVIAPYGDPGPTRWPLVQGVLVVSAAFLLGMGLRAIANRHRRRGRRR